MAARASLDGPRAKHRRALEHMQTLHREVAAFADRNPNPKTGHFDKETGRYTLAIHLSEEPEAERWGVLLGDAIHNLRSALDQVIWQLVVLNGEEPGRITSGLCAGAERAT